MSSEVEPAKQLLPYLQRADELQKHEPLVAYYCRLFAMEKGLKIPAKERTKTTNSLLISLMNQLEKDKKSVKLAADDSLYLEGFASNVFAKADKQDRAGRADLNTAKTFYAATIFFEILCQFGELQPDIEQKLKYALWKAADIRKALKEGRKPQPGPPGGDDDLTTPSTPETNAIEGSHPAVPRESFSADQPGPDSQHPEDTIARAASTVSRASHPGPDFHSGDIRQSSPSTWHDDSVYQPPYNHRTQPSEQKHLPPTYPPPDSLTHTYSHELQPPNIPLEPSRTYSQELQPPNIPLEPSRTYSQELQPPNIPLEPSPSRYSHESSPPPYTYPTFQTYPSFSESSPPATTGHYSSYYQGHESTYLQQQPPPQSFTAPVQFVGGSGSHAGHPPPSSAPTVTSMHYGTSGDNGSHAGHIPPSPAVTIPSYTYDSSYEPPVEKIAEAHKAARFAVGALAFDDVAVAVDFLRKSLELLTNPKAEIH